MHSSLRPIHRIQRSPRRVPRGSEGLIVEVYAVFAVEDAVEGSHAGHYLEEAGPGVAAAAVRSERRA